MFLMSLELIVNHYAAKGRGAKLADRTI